MLSVATVGTSVDPRFRAVYQVLVRDERREVWKWYLDLAKAKGALKHFGTALDYATVSAQGKRNATPTSPFPICVE